MANPTGIESVVERLAHSTLNDTNEDVNFAGVGLKLDSEEDAKVIVDAINNCKKLHTLKLEGNTLGVNAAKAIAKALESQPSFKRALWKDMFTGRLKSEIPGALNFLSGGLILAGAKLVELDLSDNAFGPIGVKGIQVLLESPTCYQLQELRLNNNGLGIGGGKLLSEALVRCYRSSLQNDEKFSLRIFICGRNRLENEGAIALSEFFKLVGSLEEVSMPQNGIYHEGVAALAQSFAKNPNLKTINLNDNTITEVGAGSIAQALSSLENLEVLNFGDCLLRSEGAKLVAQSVKEGHANLHEVYLGFNEIDVEAAFIVLDCLKNKSSLFKVDLDGNAFGSDGCTKLEAAFEKYLPEVLGSLDDDEGGDDDDDEDDDNEDDSNVKNDFEEDDEKDGQSDEEIPISIHSSPKKPLLPDPQPKPLQVTVKEFLMSPTPEKLLGLGNDHAEQILGEAGNESDYDKRISTFIKIARCVSADDNQVKKIVCECVDRLLNDVFINAEKNGQLANLSNSLLVHFGLIKSEDKFFKPAEDLTGPLIVLEHVVKQTYVSRITKEILQLFLSRPNKAVDSCGTVKHLLMQTLYRF